MILLLPPLLLPACTDKDGSAPSTVDTDTADTSDTDDTDTSSDIPLEISDISWSVNKEIGSVVHVSWQQSTEADAWLEFTTDAKNWQSSPVESRAAGAQEELILGVPYSSEITFRIASDEGSGTTYTDEQTAQNDDIPEEAPVPMLQVAEDETWHPSERWLLIGMSQGGQGWQSDGFWKMILNRQGEVVWARPTPDGYRTFYMQPSYDGTHIIWDENTFWTDFDKGKASLVHRMTLDGTILESIPLSGLHHTFLELSDGVITWGGIDNGREVLRERDADGNIREVWDCDAFWDEHGSTRGCDGNALFWDEPTDTIYFSSDNNHSIVQLTRTGEVLNFWGQLEGAWPFAEGTEPFWKQHSPTLTPEGNLLVSSWIGEINKELVAREYEIDKENQVLREAWTCGAGTQDIAYYAGEAHRLASGNTLLNYGEGGQIREYTPDCDVAWHLEWEGGPLLGRAVFLEELYDFAP